MYKKTAFYSLAMISMLLMSSCFVAKKYERPTLPEAEVDLFRPEYQQVDSSNIALLSWNEFFKDPFLKKYIEKALQQNLDLAVATEQIKIAQAYYRQATASLFPTLGVSPGLSYQTQSLNTQFGQIIGQRRHIFQYDLTGSLTWEADIWGKLSSAKRAALADWNRNIAAQQAVQTSLVSSLASIYYQLLVLDEQKKITQATIRTRARSLETSKALKESGTLTEVAVQQSEALMLNAQALEIQLDNQIKLLENTFNLLLGEPSKKVERMRLDQQDIQSDLAYGVPYQLLSNRPDIRAAEYNLISAFEMENSARANFYPSFRLTASTGFQSINFDDLFSPRAMFANVISSLTQPLWNKRQIRTQHEISLANKQIAYINYRRAMLTAGREVSDALVQIDAQDKIIRLKEQELSAYSNATEYAEELVNYGLANYLEVLRAQENELNTQLSLLNAQYTRLNAIVQLYKALGGGWLPEAQEQ